MRIQIKDWQPRGEDIKRLVKWAAAERLLKKAEIAPDKSIILEARNPENLKKMGAEFARNKFKVILTGERREV